MEETLAGRGGQIKEYSLGAEVFARGDDFDPRIDPIVRVQARNLRARMAKYYEGPGADRRGPHRSSEAHVRPGVYVQARSGATPQRLPETFYPRPDRAPAPEARSRRQQRRPAPAASTPPRRPGRTPLGWSRRDPDRCSQAARCPGRSGPRITKPHEPDPAAQEQYIRGRFLMDRHNEKSLRSSVACFERAIAQDPQFAAAYAGLADAYNLLAQYGYVLPAEGMEKARAAAKQALEARSRSRRGTRVARRHHRSVRLELDGRRNGSTAAPSS